MKRDIKITTATDINVNAVSSYMTISFLMYDGKGYISHKETHPYGEYHQISRDGLLIEYRI